MATEKPKRSSVGVDLVRLLAGEGDRIFSTARAREVGARVGLNDAYLLESLHHLRRNGWIVSLRRGLYALSSAVPGVPPAHEFEIAMAFADPGAVSHWSALHHHALTQQVPRKVFVLTTTEVSTPRARGAKARVDGDGYPIGGTVYKFIRVGPERFLGHDMAVPGIASRRTEGCRRWTLTGGCRKVSGSEPGRKMEERLTSMSCRYYAPPWSIAATERFK